MKVSKQGRMCDVLMHSPHVFGFFNAGGPGSRVTRMRFPDEGAAMHGDGAGAAPGSSLGRPTQYSLSAW